MARHKAKEQPAQPAASPSSRRSSQPPGQDAALRGSAGAPLVPPSLGVSAEAAAFLTASGAKLLQMAPVTLVFPPEVEGEYLADVAKRRWPVLVFVFCFDVGCYLLRLGAKLLSGHQGLTPVGLIYSLSPQLANMAMCYLFLTYVNRRSRRLGDAAARQEEYMLAAVMALAISSLLMALRRDNAQDYVLGAFFLICTTAFLKIRWFVGTAIQMMPVALCFYRHGLQRPDSILPSDAAVHICIAWAVGALMSFLSDTYRRQMFANHRLAFAAAEMEVHEAKARLEAQNQLAAAQAQAAQRKLVVAREKASNEAKSEFMSLMCHEVRTPLNGCLASAEMLLETVLQDEQRELAKTIRVSGSILLSTVSNFLDFFKMEAGKALDIVRTEVDVQELVSDVHCIIDAMIGKESGVGLLCPCTEGVPDVVLGDPDRLRGILLNLYTNAAKFTRRGAIALRVSVAGPNYRPMPSEALYGAGSAEDLARSYGGGDLLTSANLVTSAAQAAAAQRQEAAAAAAAAGAAAAGGSAQQRRASAGDSQAAVRGMSAPPSVSIPISQTFVHAPARSSGGARSSASVGSPTTSPASLAQEARAALLWPALGTNSQKGGSSMAGSSMNGSLQEWLPSASSASMTAQQPPPQLVEMHAAAHSSGSNNSRSTVGSNVDSSTYSSNSSGGSSIALAAAAATERNDKEGSQSNPASASEQVVSTHRRTDSTTEAALQAGDGSGMAADQVSSDVQRTVDQAEQQSGGGARPLSDDATDAEVLAGRLRGIGSGSPGPAMRMGEANAAEEALATHTATPEQEEQRQEMVMRASTSSIGFAGVTEMLRDSWQAATDGAEFMTAALARRCASISQLRHTGLSWHPLPATEEGHNASGSQPRSSGSGRSGSFSSASSNRSSHEMSRSSTDYSTIASDRVSYELPDMGGGRRSLDTILGPRRSMDARGSMDRNRTDAETMAAARRSYECEARRSLEAAARSSRMPGMRGSREYRRRSRDNVAATGAAAQGGRRSFDSPAEARRSFETSAAARRSDDAARARLDAARQVILGPGRQPRLSWDQPRPSTHLRAASTPEIRAGGASGQQPGRQRVSFDERTTTGGAGRGSGGVDSTQTMSEAQSSLSNGWQPGGSDRRSSGSGGRLKGRRPSGEGGQGNSKGASGTQSPAHSLSESASSNGMDTLGGEGLPPGWASVVSRPPAPRHPDQPQPKHWLVFEVMDTGIGIAERGLRSLFKEYVQGSEEEMRRPRSRGGTGLGLSICSKQVAVLGGQIGAMSKQGLGSTFWFTVPLLLPEPPRPRSSSASSSGLRRTASWSSRDAFTDGHYGAGADSGPRRKRSGSGNMMLSPSAAVEAMGEGAASEGGRTPPHGAQGPSQLRRKSAPNVARSSRESWEMPAHPNSMPNPETDASATMQMEAAVAKARWRALQPKDVFARSSLFEPSRRDGSNQPSHGGAAAPQTAAANRASPEAGSALQGRDAAAAAAAALPDGPFSSHRQQAMQHRQPEGLPSAVPEGAAVSGSTTLEPPSNGGPPGGSNGNGNGGGGNLGTWSWQSMGSEKGYTFNRSAAAAKARGMRPSMEDRRRRLDFSALQGKRVLLAEDNLINQTVAKKMLSQMGMVAVVAANGAEAVDAVTAPGAHFDVVLMDMAMPVMGGVSATKNIRGRGLDVPIVAMTANASDKDRDECLDAGMDGFLSKPVLKDRLAEALLLVLSGRGAYQDATVTLKSIGHF